MLCFARRSYKSYFRSGGILHADVRYIVFRIFFNLNGNHFSENKSIILLWIHKCYVAISYPNVRLLQSDADTVCNISVLLFCRMLLFKFSVHNFPTSPFSLNTTNPSELYLFRCGVTTMAFVTLLVLWARLTAKRILMSRSWNRSKCNGQ